MYCLAANPEVQEKLRREILQFDKIDENALAQMRYLKACLKESQRLFPLVMTGIRVIPSATVMKGYEIPANTSIMWPNELLARDDKTFSEPEM